MTDDEIRAKAAAWAETARQRTALYGAHVTGPAAQAWAETVRQRAGLVVDQEKTAAAAGKFPNGRAMNTLIYLKEPDNETEDPRPTESAARRFVSLMEEAWEVLRALGCFQPEPEEPEPDYLPDRLYHERDYFAGCADTVQDSVLSPRSCKDMANLLQQAIDRIEGKE